MDKFAGKEYLNIKEIKVLLYLLSIMSFALLIILKYDLEFKITILLPICYLISLILFVQPSIGEGMGGIAIIVMYAFRMCVLPILCAYGNFWLEPDKDVYIRYFGIAILLTCFENFLVFSSLCYFNKKYRKIPSKKFLIKNKAFVVKTALLFLGLIVAVLLILNRDFLSYFRFITAEEDGAVVNDTVSHLQQYGASYYLLVLIDLIARPLISFFVVSFFLKRNIRIGIIITLLVGVVNIVFVSDRRIISLLVGGCCIVQILPYIKKEIYKKLLYVMMICMALITIFYFFYGTTEPYLIARKFQRYFSGPTLTAIGLGVAHNYTQGPLDFFELLFNDSIILTGIFDSIKRPNYVMQLCGPAGYSIWTPMMIGSIQYFHIFAPVVITFIVFFVVKCDYIAKNSESNIYKLMMNYLSISVAVYMIMYTVDLIFYTIIFLGSLYKLLLWLDKKLIWNI